MCRCSSLRPAIGSPIYSSISCRMGSPILRGRCTAQSSPSARRSAPKPRSWVTPTASHCSASLSSSPFFQSRCSERAPPPAEARSSSTTSRYPACAAYEIYAHVLVAELRGIDDDKIATIIAGRRPGGSHARRSRRLRPGRVLPELTYQQAVDLFGEEGTAEFIYLVGLYCMVSVKLTGFDVPIPAPTK